MTSQNPSVSGVIEVTEAQLREYFTKQGRSGDQYRQVPSASYDDMLEVWGHPVVAIEDIGSYQGNSIAVVRNKDNPREFAVHQWGWGSCSGCDALQDAETWASLVEIANWFQPSMWLTKREALDRLESLRTEDWRDNEWRAACANLRDTLEALVDDAD